MAEQSSSQSFDDVLLPPADFSFLVSSLMFQAQMDLGLLRFSETDEPPQPALPRAKHSIDLLAVLQEKTKGNLTLEETRLLENGLTELRFRYVQVQDDLKAKKADDDAPRIITADGGKGTKSA